MDGKPLATYSSLVEMRNKTGFNCSAILACVDGRLYQSYGFRWESPTREIIAPPLTKGKKEVFNRYLWEKRGKPPTSKRAPIAALNLSSEDMKGEQWRPIEGTNGELILSPISAG